MVDQGNTYHLEPKEEQRFFPSKVKKVIQSVFDERLPKIVYDPAKSAQLTQQLARAIRTRLKTQVKMPRYKLGIQVVFGQNKGQGLRIASKSLWDVNYDNWASHTFQNDKLYCTGMVFGCYYE